MEEVKNRGDLQVNVVRQSPMRQGGSFKSSLSGKSTPRNSPTFRGLHSSRTPRREGKSGCGSIQWFRSNRLIYWLLLITLWTYLGFYVQSRWAHGDNNEKFLGFGGKSGSEYRVPQNKIQQDSLANESSLAVRNGSNKLQVGYDKRINVILAEKGKEVSSTQRMNSKNRSKKVSRRLRGKARDKRKRTVEVEKIDTEVQEPDIPWTNSTHGLLVGPFGSTEDRILEWSPDKRSGTCDRKGNFARLVWSRKFVLIFHELSMTGAPLSMLELATELLSCGATVSTVVLSKKGGLMPELAKRKIKVLEDKADLSFKSAMKADLVIAGSAVCASWVDQYIAKFPAGGSQIVWWIMENRREYFDRSKIVLHRVKMLVFLSESQTKQWLKWCEEDNIKLRSPPAVVPLSVNDELAFVAGIPCSLNAPSSSPEKMLEKRQLLRDSIRKQMGLEDDDMLVMSISSINQGKGQLLLLESANLLFEQKLLPKVRTSADAEQGLSTLAAKHHLRALLQVSKYSGEGTRLNETKKVDTQFPGVSKPVLARSHTRRKALAKSKGVKKSKAVKKNIGVKKHTLKVLIGSVGSKSNKVLYVKEILSFLSQHSNLSKSVLWTPATTRVASLYSAADVYTINSQGQGETFGRVTVEAMAFGLPVLGTDAGGTTEIVDHNVTGLLHPVGRPGTHVLAQNIQFLLENPSARKQMGIEGRKKVERMYLKRQMYKKFGEVLYGCMRIK